jgi:hypothetical protein
VTPGLHRLYDPRPATVEAGPDATPLAVDGVAVEALREEWLVADRWWTPQPLRRRYFELALAGGSAVVVFRCGLSGRWYRQRA